MIFQDPAARSSMIRVCDQVAETLRTHRGLSLAQARASNTPNEARRALLDASGAFAPRMAAGPTTIRFRTAGCAAR